MDSLTNFPNGITSFGGVITPTLSLIHTGSSVDNGGSIVRPNKHFWVNGDLGNDGNIGLNSSAPLRTMSAAFAQVGSGDVIHVNGNITEQLTTPAGIFDVTIIGEGNLPRNADTHTVNNGYSSATWKFPSSPTAATPLLKIQQQGWRIANILFSGSLSATAQIQTFRNGASGSSERDGSHTHIIGCRFDGGGAIGVQDSGGCNFVNITGNSFRGYTTASINNVTGAGIGTLLNWNIEGNRFYDSLTHIDLTLNQSTIWRNIIGKFTATTGFGIDLTGGTGNNVVTMNYLSGDYDGDYVAAANDEWAGNYSMDLASDEVGDNGITTAAPVA